MKKENEMSVSEFARICGMTREALIYYDRIGLFSPARTDEAGYRYYAHRQIGAISTIQLLACLGVPLKKIREDLAGITPEKMETILFRQREVVAEKIKKLREVEGLIALRLSQIEESRSAEGVRRETLAEAVPFYISKRIRGRKDAPRDEWFMNFYHAAEDEGMPFGYTTGYIVPEEALAAGAWRKISHLCFRLPDASHANGWLPAGEVIAAWAKGMASDAAYAALAAYMEKEGLRPRGPAFEEYLLDEATNENEEDFLCRVTIPVEEA